MDEESPSRLGRWAAGLAFLGLVAVFVFFSINQAATRIGSGCGTVLAVENAQNEGPADLWITVQPSSGEPLKARAHPGLSAVPGDVACWHVYRKVLAGQTVQIHAVRRPDPTSIYFPGLAVHARRFDPAALESILELSTTTAPGEKLEDLAEMASRYVAPRADVFLRAQSTRSHCFGVEFMGPRFVDNDAARQAERAARRQALMAVDDPALAGTRERCLAEMGE